MTGQSTVRTAQLILRPASDDDVGPLFEIQGDAEAMRFTRIAESPADTAAHLEAYRARLEIDGYGPWTAVDPESDRVVGWGGLNRDPFDLNWGPEVGYFIHKDWWGRGLASEITSAALDLAFGSIGLPEVVAFAMPANRASLRVLEKSGFVLDRYLPSMERNLYRVSAESRIRVRAGSRAGEV